MRVVVVLASLNFALSLVGQRCERALQNERDISSLLFHGSTKVPDRRETREE